MLMVGVDRRRLGQCKGKLDDRRGNCRANPAVKGTASVLAVRAVMPMGLPGLRTPQETVNKAKAWDASGRSGDPIFLLKGHPQNAGRLQTALWSN